jgi:P4 family phage/plasmid primase-like protien
MNCDTQKKTSTTRRRQTVEYALDKCTNPNVEWNQLLAEEIAFKDGIVNILTGERKRHNWKMFLTSIIPHSYDAEALCPTWLGCLDFWFDDANDKKMALQEYMGYILCLHAKYKKSLVLFGESNTGKSVVCDVAIEMVSKKFFSCVSLEDMDDPAMCSPLKGSMLNICTELSADSMLADGGFKKIVSNEPIQINQKYSRLETIVPVAKILVATNNLPRIPDINSQGVFNRLLIIKFNKIVEERERGGASLESKLKQEIQGIISWAVEGAKRLIKNNGIFTEVEESKLLLKDYQMNQNAVLGYIEQSGEIEYSAGSHVVVETFCRKFNAWNGGKEYSTNAIGRIISNIKLPSGEKIKSMPVNGKRVYKGLKWSAGPKDMEKQMENDKKDEKKEFNKNKFW